MTRRRSRPILHGCALLSALVLLALSIPQRAPAALYRGDGQGIRVEFRIEHRRIVLGRIWAVELCTDRKGHRRRHPFDVYIGDYVHDKDLPAPPTTLFMEQPVSEGGRFRYDDKYRQPAFSHTLFFGQARPDVLTGGFLQVDNGVFAPEGTSCRTDRFHHPRHPSKRSGILHFRARRVWAAG